jgi:hypothetical protein
MAGGENTLVDIFKIRSGHMTLVIKHVLNRGKLPRFALQILPDPADMLVFDSVQAICGYTAADWFTTSDFPSEKEKQDDQACTLRASAGRPHAFRLRFHQPHAHA